MRVEQMKQQPAAVPEVQAGALSAKGLRQENQDAMTRFQSRFGDVILVADGMGGHQGGATASGIVAERFGYYLAAVAPAASSLEDALQQATARVNDEVYERGHSGDPAIAGMGSTIVVAVIRSSPAGREAVIANAGDSRAYLVRDGVPRQITNDHTVAQRMVEAGMLTPENARSHPQGSVLTRALGQQLGTTVETYPPLPLQPGDALLLCSDGLSGYVTDDKIAPVVATPADPGSIAQSLIDLALKNGSDDNITVQYVRYGERPAPAPPVQPIPPSAQRWLLIAAIIAAVLLGAPLGWYAWQRLAVKAAKVGAGKPIPAKGPATAGGGLEPSPAAIPPPSVRPGAETYEAPISTPSTGGASSGESTGPAREKQAQKTKKNTSELRPRGVAANIQLCPS